MAVSELFRCKDSISRKMLRRFVCFLLRNRKIAPLRIVESKDFLIFAPAKSGEIDLARESAFFALFLRGELGQFTNEKRLLKDVCFCCYVALIHTT